MLSEGDESKLDIDENGFVIYDKTLLVGYVGTETDIIIPIGIEEIYSSAFLENQYI